MVKNSTLRAEAPVFQPSFHSITPAPDNANTARAMSASSKSNWQKRRKQDSGSRRSGGNKQQPTRRSEKKDTDNPETEKKRNRRGRQRPTQKFKAESRDTTAYSNKEEEMLPLHLESSFPALSSPSISCVKPVSSVNLKTWKNVDAKIFFRPNAFSQEGNTDHGTDEFEVMGLQKLSTRTQGARNRTPAVEYSAWETEESTALEDPKRTSLDFDDKETDSDVTIRQVQNDLNLRRRTHWNMNKLRDKWWDVIDHRKTRRRVLLDLQRILPGRFVEAEEGDSEIDKGVIESNDDVLESMGNGNVEEGNQTHSHDIPQETPLQALLNDASMEFSTDMDKVLEKIVQNCDQMALEEYLHLLEPEEVTRVVEILDKVIRLDLPKLLKTVLMYLNANKVALEKSSEGFSDVAKGLMLAAFLGQEECVSLFLLKLDDAASLVMSKDEKGNTVFHHCCHKEGNLLVLQSLLHHISDGKKSKQQQLSRALLARNKVNETALHKACASGRVDFVEMFLSSCSTALLAKILAIEDNISQTPLLAAVQANASDVVMCLIMWRGNRNSILRKTTQTPGTTLGKNFILEPSNNRGSGDYTRLPPCPLVWAGVNGNLDMIHLLLQFSDPSGKDYQTTESVHALLLSRESTETKAEGSQVLVQNGANPFAEINIGEGSSRADTALGIAARACESKVLHCLASSGIQQLRHIQEIRRKEPKLRQQPDSFFKSMECKEDFEMERALCNALVESLYRGFAEEGKKEKGHMSTQPLDSAISLYALGTQMKEKDLARLQLSLQTQHLEPASILTESAPDICLVGVRILQPISPLKSSVSLDIDRSELTVQSRLLFAMDWFRSQLRAHSTSCEWLSDELRFGTSHINDSRWIDEEIFLEAEDGTRFTVHESIVSASSAKLASALRFATMQEAFPEGLGRNTMRVLFVEISSQSLGRMIQHIYHGSISCGWPENQNQFCQEIFELMLVAEEFLCFSLLQECEIRLLSSKPRECFCCSCAKAVRFAEGNKKRVECLYYNQGPSCLISGHNVLDLLAVLQHLEGAEYGYKIQQVARPMSWLQCVAPDKLWDHSSDTSIWSENAALATLKYEAFKTILLSFNEVAQSGSFLESVELYSAANMPGEFGDEKNSLVETEAIQEQKVLLLRLCLEEISAMNLPRAFEKYNIAKQQKSTLLCRHL